MNKMCLIVTPEIRKLTENITQVWPEASKRAGLTADMVAEWVGAYNQVYGQQPDFVPTSTALVNYVEKQRNMDGKSFKYVVESITYNLPGQAKQTYTVIGNKIYNKDGKEVFTEAGKHRNRIFANIAVQQGRAVVVEHKDKKYVVNNKNQIISVTTGDIMQWGDENGDRKAILALAKAAFEAKQKAATSTTNIGAATDSVKDREQLFNEMRKKLSKEISVGRSGYLSVRATPNDYNGAPIITVSVYNSASDMATDTQYRLNANGNLESRFKWSDEEWKENWQEKPSEYNVVNEFFNALKSSTALEAPRVIGENIASDGSEFAKLLTNPGNNLQVEYKGKIFRNAEHAYQTWKSGEFDEVAYNSTAFKPKGSKPVNKQTNYQTMVDILKAKLQQHPELVEGITQRGGEAYLKASTHKVTGDKYWESTGQNKFIEALTEAYNAINQGNNRSNNNQINYGNEFRRVQESVRGSSKEGDKVSSVSTRDIGEDARLRLAGVLRDELRSKHSSLLGSSRVNLIGKGNNFLIHKEVNPQLFHDIFEVVRYYTPNAELVDLHDDYSNCKCYLNEDGTCGFAIEGNGNLISVFNLGTTKGFLWAIKDFAIAEGATHLDAYASNKQDLRSIYEKVFGAKVTSSMDYNMEFDHDDIAKNHGNPQVVFMVMGEAAKGEVKERHFDKDSYDDAVSYQLSLLKRQQFNPERNPVLEQFKKNIDLLAGYFEGSGAYITDVLPNLSESLQRKLENYFMGDGELTLEDYRDLWKAIEFVDTGNKFPEVRERKAPTSSTSSNAASSLDVGNTEDLAAGGASLGFSPNAVPAGSMEDVYQSLAAQAAQQQSVQSGSATLNKPKPERPNSVAYESALKPNDSRVARFKRTFSPQQIKDRGAMIADKFSNIIDNALWDEIDACLDVIESDTASEEEKTQAKMRMNDLRDPLKGRQLVVQEKGISVIMDEILQSIRVDKDYSDRYTKDNEERDRKSLLYQNTIDYFTDLFNTQATLDIEEREGIRIVGLDVAEQTAAEDDNDAQDDGDDETGHTASGSDGWSFQVRYEDPFNALSKKVRSMMYDIERPASEKDDLGNTRKYPMGQIYASLLSYLAKNMHSADDFIQIDKSYEGKDNWGNDITENTYPNGYPTFPVLEKMLDIYPWVGQIIQRLTDDYMNPEWNTNLRYPATCGTMASQFYTNFRKAYIPYAKIQLGDGKFGVTPLNYEMEERAQFDKLEANYNNRMILTDSMIYDASGKVSKENAKKLGRKIKSIWENVRSNYYGNFPELIAAWEQDPDSVDFSQEDVDEYNEFIDTVRYILNSYGIDATRDTAVAYTMMNNGNSLFQMLGKLAYINDLIQKLDDSRIDSFNYILDLKNPYGENQWKHFFDGAGMITDASYMQSFYDSASHKTKYSYSADNYLMKMFRGACMGTLAERRQFIDEHFGKYEWFKNQKTGEWRNKWLEYWYNEPAEQYEIPYKNIDNITDYSGDEVTIRQYTKWVKDDIWQVQNRSFNKDSKSPFAFFLAPIFSDSPMSMTVKGPKMTMQQLLYGYNDTTGHHQGALVALVSQELWRIGYVQDRVAAITDGTVEPISNFDTGRGQQFCFLPELNTYQFEATDRYPAESFLSRMIRMKNAKATLAEIEQYQIQAIQDIINAKMGEYAAENLTHYDSENPISPEVYYNMVYANAAIIQMTTVDLAFYKNDTDFQKRYKEVYAGGIQLNTNSKYGKKTENIFMLSDDIITSPSYDKVAAVIDSSTTLSNADKEFIKSSFMEINVADAQAIRAMHSFRSVLDMMGRWDDRMEEALQHFRENKWSREDFDILWQTIKPFAYSVIDRNDGFGGSIPVPQQNKNSEICALMMYDLITNDLNNSPVYKALSRFMEETVDANGEPLIDMVQFESAGKVGNQGVVNISFNPNKVISVIEQGVVVNGNEYEFYTDEIDANDFAPNDLEHVAQNYEAIKHQLDLQLQEGRIPQDDYNKIMEYLRPTEDEIIDMLSQAVLITNPDGSKGINTEVVHTIPFDNYYQQQPTPEHHIDAEATFGSQARNIIVADLPDGMEITVNGKGKNKKTFKGKDAIIDFYYELLNENLIEDFFGKGNKQGLKGIFSSKESFRDAVTDIVHGNPKYGKDFIEALQLDDNGDFVLSPNSPTMFNLMQELVTSFFKNRITKQTINGAALIQAAGIGLDNDLRIVFDDDGKLLGAECLMPLTTKKFFEPLLEEKVINGEKVQVLSPKKLKAAGLDKAIGYRIPTENKSSMMPLIIKGFTPLQNGSCIVLPAEITNIAGSDFDVDKMFIMLMSFYIQTHDMRAAREAWAKRNDIIGELSKIFYNSDLLDELSESDPEDFKEWFEEHKDEFELKEPRIHRIEYDFNKSPKENGRKARNNMLIQMMFNILTSKEGSESLFNPQGFKDVKKAAKITRILTDPTLNEALQRNSEAVAPGVLPSSDTILSEFLSIVQERYPDKYDAFKQAVTKMTTEQIQQAYIQAVTAGNKGDAIQLLMDSSTKDLEKFIEQNSAPESPVFPQTFAHSHARNMAGSNQIGIYAIQGSMAAKYQRADVRMREEQQFTVNGRKITNVDVSDGGRRLKNVGQMVGASADNGKDPNLSDMGSTSKTAPMIGYMLRTGLSHLEAALIINQPHMVMSMYNSKNYKYWKSILGKNPLATPVENVTTEMLIKGLMNPFELTAEEDKQIAALCYRILMQHEAQEYLTQISRADSPNGSMQNSYAKTRIQQYKVDLFQAKMGQRDFPFIRIKEAIGNNAIDTSASEDVVREQLKGQRMAFLHGMYALGINSFNDLVSPYFFGATKHFDDAIVKPILYNLNEKLSDAKKEDIVNKIYTSYITFMLSGSSLFGSEEGASMKQKRDYYLESFPDDYMKVIQENEDIRELLSSVLQVKNFGSRKRVILQDVGSLSKGQKQDVQRRFESLAYSENPAARQLAKDLFVYSYFDNGLQFTHDSFSHLFTTEFLINFPVYNETLQSLDTQFSEEEEKNFIYQFLLTYPEATYNVNNIITSDNVNDDRIIVDLNNPQMRERMINEVMSPNPQFEGINIYPYISYNGEVYILDQDLFAQYPGTPVYRKLPEYATYPRLPLFNRQMNVTQMAQEFPIDNSQPEMPDVGSVPAPDAPMAHNEGTDNPDVDNSMNAAFDSMDDFDPDFDPSDMDNIPTSKSDTYSSEGNTKLQKPMCG